MDDRSQPRINVEAEAVLAILRVVESGDLELLSSAVVLPNEPVAANYFRPCKAQEAQP